VTALQVRGTPLLARSKKKKGIRMGGSKGGFFCFVYRAHAGTILFEVHSILNYQVVLKLRRVALKFPVKTAVVFKRD
jgi:ribosomal protein L16/L10AE